MTEEELQLAEEINQLSNNFEENKDRVIEIARILTAKLS
jgi:ribosomal protein S17E